MKEMPSFSGQGVVVKSRLLAETPATISQTQKTSSVRDSGSCVLEVSGEKLRLTGGETENGGDGEVIPSIAVDRTDTGCVLLNVSVSLK